MNEILTRDLMVENKARARAGKGREIKSIILYCAFILLLVYIDLKLHEYLNGFGFDSLERSLIVVPINIVFLLWFNRRFLTQ